MKRDHGALIVRELLEGGPHRGHVRWLSSAVVGQVDLAFFVVTRRKEASESPDPRTADSVCLVDNDAIDPLFDQSRVADRLAPLPGTLERGLNGVLGIVRVPRDEPREADQPR